MAGAGGGSLISSNQLHYINMLWTEHSFDYYDLDPSNPHVARSRALAGPRFHEPDVKFGNAPLQRLGRASLC